MIRITRRNILAGGVAGALTLPVHAALASRTGGTAHAQNGAARMGTVLLHDPALAAGERFAAAGTEAGGAVLAIDGDRIRLARKALDMRPGLIVGLSRHADALLIADAAHEEGYVQVAELEGRANACTAQHCRPQWQALGRLAASAEGNWIEALATYCTGLGNSGQALSDATRKSARKRSSGEHKDAGFVFGWVLAPGSTVSTG